MKLSDVLKTVAAQSGISNEDAGLQQLLGTAAIANIEVDEEVSGKLVASRLTIEAAKNSPDLKRYFFAQALDGVDAKLKPLQTDDNIDEDFKNVLKSGSTYDKVAAIKDRMVELQLSKSGASRETKEVVNKELIRLNEDLKKANDRIAEVESKAKEDISNARVGWEIEKIYTNPNLNWSVGKGIKDNNLRIKMIDAAMKDLMARDPQGVTFRVDEAGQLTPYTKEGTLTFEDNRQMTAFDYIRKQALANGLLEAAPVAQQNAPKAPANTQQAFQAAVDQKANTRGAERRKQLAEEAAKWIPGQ